MAELGALLAERGEALSARDRLAIRSAVHTTPDGVDPVAAAARLRSNYGAGGKAANRRIGNVVAVLIAEIEQSSPARAAAERPAGGSARTRRRSPESESTESRAAREAKYLRVHQSRPVALDPPSRYLEAAWETVLEALMTNWGIAFGPIQSIGLAGELITLVSDSENGEQPQRSIVLEGDPDELAAISHKGSTITRFFEHVLEVEGVIVEVAPNTEAAERTAAA